MDLEVASLARAPQTVMELSSFGFERDSANQFRIELHHDQSADVFITQRVHHKASVTLVGACEGAPPWSFVVTFSQETAAGRLRAPDGTAYDVLPLGEGRALLTSVANADDEGCAVVHDEVEIHDAPLAATESADESAHVRWDILVAFTPGAAADAGGAAGMLTVLDHLETSTNEILANSGVDASVRIVHGVVTNYDETGVSLGLTLSFLELPNDGIMDELHGVRDAYGADMVALITRFGSAGCGIAYVFGSSIMDFSDNAFSVTRLDCVFSLLTFAHEIGHNMGCAHDAPNAGVLGHFPFSFGYTGPGWRTVMATSNGPKIPHFSNPDVLFNGDPTGAPVDGPSPASNALSLNLLRKTIASWRPEVACLPFDLNADGVINGVDVSILIASWGGVGDSNVDGIGVVDGADLAQLLGNWGACPDVPE